MMGAGSNTECNRGGADQRRLHLQLPASMEGGPTMATQGRMRRIIAHWTAGAGRASPEDRAHYHRLTEGDGTTVHGKEAIEDNIVTSDGDYAAHTLRLNTGSIGVAMCGMRGAIESPFDPGPSPITEYQFIAFCQMIAGLCIEYGIPVTPSTVLTHAEVETTLGVKQRGKWDITRLPWAPDVQGARAVGNLMRQLVAGYCEMGTPDHAPRALLRFGANGVSVAEMQADLAALGYFSGRVDGDFGPLTRAALLAFQADQGLATDGVAGMATWAALEVAEPRPARTVSPEEIAATSGTVADARMNERLGDLLGAGGVATMAAQVSAASAVVDDATGLMGRVSAAVGDNWPVAALVAGCLFAWLALRALGYTTRKRRLRDAREHRSLAR